MAVAIRNEESNSFPKIIEVEYMEIDEETAKEEIVEKEADMNENGITTSISYMNASEFFAFIEECKTGDNVARWSRVNESDHEGLSNAINNSLDNVASTDDVDDVDDDSDLMESSDSAELPQDAHDLPPLSPDNERLLQEINQLVACIENELSRHIEQVPHDDGEDDDGVDDDERLLQDVELDLPEVQDVEDPLALQGPSQGDQGRIRISSRLIEKANEVELRDVREDVPRLFNPVEGATTMNLPSPFNARVSLNKSIFSPGFMKDYFKTNSVVTRAGLAVTGVTSLAVFQKE